MPEPMRILVVDDDRDTVDSELLLLARLGYQVLPAYNAPEALKIAEASPPQVVLLDAAMPGYDGLRLARELRQLPGTKSAVIVCISGYGTEQHRQQALDAGCDYHFLKPVDDWQEIIDVIEHVGADKDPAKQ